LCIHLWTVCQHEGKSNP